MRYIVKLFSIITFCFAFSFEADGQNDIESKSFKLDASRKHTIELLKEIYLDRELAESYILFSMSLVERTEIVLDEEGGEHNYISNLYLINKINPSLSHDIGNSFSIDSFNPLKYFWKFKEDGSTEYYRIDKTPYCVKISSPKDNK